ncbi:ABC transporter permease [Geminisphaera colitermitum]|uniref:ABC transporter permease n=1 Tax=Geminisphaera colitermitum TaxID=1148786 RepID=UPI000158CD4B|nr:ABC transporter permease [Geminisphaera colitermitum]
MTPPASTDTPARMLTHLRVMGSMLRLAFTGLVTNKLRSSLTMLGIAVGVFSVIGVMTIISALRSSIESGLSVLGSSSFQITKSPAISFTTPRLHSYFANRRNITYVQAARFKQLLGADALVGLQITRGGARASRGEHRTNPNLELIGADENFAPAANYEIAAGRNLDPSDVEFGRPVCVIGDDVVKRLFANEEPIGQQVRVAGQNYTVIGTFAPKNSSFGRSQDNKVITPVTRWLQIYGQAQRTMNINVQAPSQSVFEATQDHAIGAMRIVRGLAPEDPNDFEIYSNDSLIETFNNTARLVTIGAFVISAIALLASGVGVMNIMLVSVTERTREIGIRKSIGARSRSVLLQFLAEAVALSLVGGLGGVLLGVVAGNIVVAGVFKAQVMFPYAWAAAGIFVCGGIGVGFGLYPAWKAASLDPIEALRFE